MDDAPILICFDGSDGAEHAIAAAAALLGSRRAVVLNVAPVLTVAESYAAIGTPGPFVYEGLNRAAALEQADAGAKLARAAGLTAEARADVAAPTWDGIIEVADEISAAAIVIGSRGLTGTRELLHGSLSHEVAEHAGRPVIIVPPPRSRPNP
jgi:nucleotide-binding universal stress UspA family protein